jgi:hypothetical protein
MNHSKIKIFIEESCCTKTPIQGITAEKKYRYIGIYPDFDTDKESESIPRPIWPVELIPTESRYFLRYIGIDPDKESFFLRYIGIDS